MPETDWYFLKDQVDIKILDGQGKKGDCPNLWDGKTARRIVEVLSKKGYSA